MQLTIAQLASFCDCWISGLHIYCAIAFHESTAVSGCPEHIPYVLPPLLPTSVDKLGAGTCMCQPVWRLATGTCPCLLVLKLSWHQQVLLPYYYLIVTEILSMISTSIDIMETGTCFYLLVLTPWQQVLAHVLETGACTHLLILWVHQTCALEALVPICLSHYKTTLATSRRNIAGRRLSEIK